MKNYLAKIKINLRESILDVQGKAVEHALHSLEYDLISNVRIGKYVKMNIEAQNDGQAFTIADEACKKLIANPIIEDYLIEIEEIS